MANGQTGNYGLNQWAAEDKVIRTEFNEDNAKIDAALEAMDKTIFRIVTGTYTGNNETSQTIELGFAPKIVIVATNGGFNSGRVHETGVQIAFIGQASAMLALTETGFTVSGDGQYGLNSARSSFNPFHYLAFY